MWEQRPDSSEGENEIIITIIDEIYARTGNTAGEEYQKALEAEFDVHFDEANIGPGFDIPTFLTKVAVVDVPLWTVLFGAFLLGKPIHENLEAWNTIAGKIRRFFSRPVVLSRNGASVIAVEAVFEKMGGIPKTIRLLSYRSAYYGPKEKIASYSPSSTIAPTPPILNIGMMKHVFEIEADGVKFRVAVDGNNTEVIKFK